MTEKMTDFEVNPSESMSGTDSTQARPSGPDAGRVNVHPASEQAVSGPPDGPALTSLLLCSDTFLHKSQAGFETRSGSRARGLKPLVPGSLSALNYAKASLSALNYAKASLSALNYAKASLSHPKLSSPVYGPALLLLLAACGGSTGGNPNSFIPPVTRIDEDGVTLLKTSDSESDAINGDKAAVQGGQSGLAAVLADAGVARADADIVSAHGIEGAGVYVLSSDVVARITSDYIDEFAALAYGEGAAQPVSAGNTFTGHTDFGTFILSHADSDDYSRNYGPGAHVLSYQLAPSAVHVDLSNGGSSTQRYDGIWADSWSAEDQIHSAINHIIGSPFNDTLLGNQYSADAETFEGGPGVDTIDGRDGIDTASYEHSQAPVDVSLTRQGTSGIRHNQRGGDAVGDVLTNIENLIGTVYADRLTGDDGDNIFYGLFGGDEIDGQGGTDTASYARSGGPVHINLLEGANSQGFIGVQLGNGASNDRLKSIENIEGSRYDDSFHGNGQANRFDGGAGDDRWYWSEGSDTFDGGAGSDTADFGRAEGALTVNLNGSAEVNAAIADGDTDKLANVETVIGTEFDDTITGDNSDNRLIGGAGDDTLAAGGDGAKVFIGGPGADTMTGRADLNTLSYDTDTQSATGYGVVMERQLGNDKQFILNNVTNLNAQLTVGSDQDETYYIILQADDDDNPTNSTLKVVNGALNNSATNTRKGQDGEGAYAVLAVIKNGDFLWQMHHRHNGNETPFFVRNGSNFQFNNDKALTDFTDPDDGYNAEANGDSWTGMRRFIGTDNDDVLIGLDAGADKTYADGGDSTYSGPDIADLNGGAGNDIIFGLGGDDWINGGEGADYIDGGAGSNDTAFYIDARTGVIVDLYDNDLAEQQGEAQGDILISIENLRGSDHADRLYGNELNNDIWGNGGNDILSGRDGDDFLYGGGGHDTLYGGVGADTLHGDDGNDTLYGDSGHGNPEKSGGKTIIPGAGLLDLNADYNDNGLYNDSLYGGDGNDTLYGHYGDDTLHGGAGRNSLYGGDGDDSFNPTLNADGSDYTVARTDLDGIVTANYFDGGAGDDQLDYSLHNGFLTFAAGTTGVSTGKAADLSGGASGTPATATFAGLTFTAKANGASGNNIDIAFAYDPSQTAAVTAAQGGTNNNTITITLGSRSGATLDEIKAAVEGISSVKVDVSLVDADTGSNRIQPFDDNQGTGVTVFVGSGNRADYYAVPDELANLRDQDRTVNVEYVRGTVGKDRFYLAGKGAFVEGAGGEDHYISVQNNTHDYVSYRSSVQGVTVYLDRTGTNTGDAEGDSFTNILNVEGSAHDDTLYGTGGDNILIGGDGDDTLDGRGGIDTASYAGAGTGVTVSLESPEQDTIGAGTDTLISIENLIGSDHDDTLTGDDGDNHIHGGAGNDTLDGGDGNDELHGGAGDDVILSADLFANTIDGGAGSDTLSYADLVENEGANIRNWLAGEPETAYPRGGEDFTSTDPSDSFIPINGIFAELDQGKVFKQHGADTANISDTGIKGIENITGSAFDDYIRGDEAANILVGGGGEDYLYGEDGDDTLHGNDDHDTLVGGAGDDRLYGGAGADWLEGGADNDVLTGGTGRDVLDGGGGSNTASYAAYTETNGLTMTERGADTAGVTVRLGVMRLSADAVLNTTTVTATANTDTHIILQQDGTLEAVATLKEQDGSYVVLAFLATDGSIIWQRQIDGTDLFDTATTNTHTLKTQLTEGDALLTMLQQDGISYTGIGGNAEGDVLTDIQHLTGGDGADRLYGDAGANTLDGGDGSDILIGGDGIDRLNGEDGNDILRGGLGDDTLTGGDGDDTLYGGSNNDTLAGGDGLDRLDGEDGSDTLAGGAGTDTLIGGEGADKFVLDQSAAAGDTDTVTDFSTSDGDLIQVDTAAGNETTLAGLGLAVADKGSDANITNTDGSIVYLTLEGIDHADITDANFTSYFEVI